MSDQELIEYLASQAALLSKVEGANTEGAALILYAMCGALQVGTFPELIKHVQRFVEGEIGRITN